MAESTGRRQDLFWIGADRALWHKWDDGKAWHPEESLGGILTSAPVACWNADMTRLDVYARGGDNTLQHIWYTAAGWHQWEAMGSILASGPALADWSPTGIGPQGPPGPPGPPGSKPSGTFPATVTIP